MNKVSLYFVVLVTVWLVLGMAWMFSLAGQGAVGGPLVLTQPSDLASKKIAPFVPTPQVVVDRMLEMAQIQEGDVVYDLGSGDGRIVIAAAKNYGVEAVGFEIDPRLVQQSRERIRKERLGHLAEIRQQDILTVDLTAATVVTMYLFPAVNLLLRPNIQKQLKPGSRVVSHAFDMGEWQPLTSEYVENAPGWGRRIYLWRIGDQTGNLN